MWLSLLFSPIVKANLSLCSFLGFEEAVWVNPTGNEHHTDIHCLPLSGMGDRIGENSTTSGLT